MPTFEIPDGPTTVDLKRSGDAQNPGPATGSVVFNVTNTSSDSCAGRLSVVPSGSAKAEWFAIDGDRERTFAAGETQTAKINVSVPKDAPAGEYPFKLRAVAVNDPDNDHSEGPVATAKLSGPAAPAPTKSLWWLWLIIALVVLALIGGGVWFAFFRDKGSSGTTTTTKVEAPDFTRNGMTLDQATKDPKGFKISGTAVAAGGKAPGTILSQDPAPKAPVTPGQEIKVTYDPGVDVPQVANKGMTLSSAVTALSNAHLTVGRMGRPSCQATGLAGEVVGQNPGGGQKAALNAPVELSLRALNGILDGERINCRSRLDLSKQRAVFDAPTSKATTALDRIRGSIR